MKLTLKEIEALRANPSGLLRGMDDGREWAFETFRALLDSARALARLEAWLRADKDRRVNNLACFGESGACLGLYGCSSEASLASVLTAPDLAAAIHKAPDKAQKEQG